MEGKSMNYAVYNIALDIHKTGSQVALSMIRGENKRRVVISLMENGRPYKIADGCKAYFAATKPDGKFIYNDCEIDFENNLIIYNITSQTTAAMGEVKCQIELIGSDGGLLFTPTFSLVVANKLYNQEPILASSEEFKALTSYLADLQQKLANGEFKGDKGDKGDSGDRGPQGVQGDTGPAGKDADVSELAPAIVCISTGSSIVVSDSSESGFEGFSIYGKSTQNGTPTPDAPVDIVSVGDDGNIIGGVYGKVLTNWNNATIEGNPIFSYAGNKIQYENNTGTHCSVSSIAITLPSGTYTAYVKNMTDKTNKALVGIKGQAQTQYLSNATQRIVLNLAQTTKINLIATTNNLIDKLAYSCYVGIVKGDISLENCPMIDDNLPPSQVFNLALSLKGVPVTDSSLATYTDANGQMWCADEIDLERGVYVQRVKRKRITSGATWHYSDATNRFYSHDGDFEKSVMEKPVRAFCTHFVANKDSVISDCEFSFVNDTTNSYAYRYDAMNGSIDEWRAFLDANEVYVVGILATSIETPLTSEQISAYKALKTNYPSTTILNDENAFMKVAYRADTKNFIKRMAGSTTQISSVTLAASKWVGSASPYSQVVTIPGTTKNSKIDLNPNIEQLNIFHTKDIAFVVGNNNGTITVYCIGQKPTQDYTMQVTITEVAINE